jgi:hypothetical protein
MITISLRAQTAHMERTDTFCYRFLFVVDRYDLDAELGKNTNVMHQIDSLINYYHKFHYIDSLDISAYTSLDGSWEYNKKLSQNRAETIRRYLLKNYPFLNHIPLKINGLGENWDSFRMEIENDEQVPLRKQLLEIIDNTGLNYNQKELKIKQLGKGETYSYLVNNILPFQRKAEIVFFRQGIDPVLMKTEPEKLMKEEIQAPVKIDIIKRFFPPEPFVEKSKFWAIKANLLQLGMGVAGIGVEYPIGDRFSVDLPLTYSPYTIKNNWRIRTLSVQPEFRWWWKEQMRGHFLGLHGHLAYYNLSWNKEYRYQDRNGDTPLWGAGLSYGYSVLLGKRWNLEFTLGAGYTRLEYDIFYNVNNGAWYADETKNYWGITQAGISLVYKLDIRK